MRNWKEKTRNTTRTTTTRRKTTITTDKRRTWDNSMSSNQPFSQGVGGGNGTNCLSDPKARQITQKDRLCYDGLMKPEQLEERTTQTKNERQQLERKEENIFCVLLFSFFLFLLSFFVPSTFCSSSPYWLYLLLFFLVFFSFFNVLF